MILPPTSQISHHHIVVNITMSSTSLSPNKSETRYGKEHSTLFINSEEWNIKLLTELSPRSCSTQNRLVNRHQNRLLSARKCLSICRRVLSNLVLVTVHNFDFHLKSLLLTVNLFWSEIVFHNLSVVFKQMPDHAWSLIDCSSGTILKTDQKHTKLDCPK